MKEGIEITCIKNDGYFHKNVFIGDKAIIVDTIGSSFVLWFTGVDTHEQRINKNRIKEYFKNN